MGRKGRSRGTVSFRGCLALPHNRVSLTKSPQEKLLKGDLMEGELYSALKEEEASESVSSTNFSGEMHFYELVEDTKDGIWLVQVIANDRSPLVGKIHWEKMVKKVSRFGIRTGTFNCSSDPSTYLGHGLLIDYFEKKRRRNNNDEVNANNLEWLSSLWDWYTSYLFHPIASFQNFPVESDWDEDPDLFLERLAFPDLWLHPLIPTDYIKNLPMWRFRCLGVQSEEELSEGSQDIENDSDNIQREEEKVKRSVKDAAKKGQKDVCVVLAKEMIRSRKAVSKLYASKAHMNSVLMGMKNQLAVLRVAGSLQKSTEVMKAMQSLVKIPEIQATMRELSKEMMKAGIIEEMLEDTFESMDDQEEMEEAAEMEIDKILFEITADCQAQWTFMVFAVPNYFVCWPLKEKTCGSKALWDLEAQQKGLLLCGRCSPAFTDVVCEPLLCFLSSV
ncbi:hypothetical protein CB1_000688058 [Camelus ferus]|nr:hypothetical protein CB1_000688058 [Camelus ferus]